MELITGQMNGSHGNDVRKEKNPKLWILYYWRITNEKLKWNFFWIIKASRRQFSS